MSEFFRRGAASLALLAALPVFAQSPAQAPTPAVAAEPPEAAASAPLANSNMDAPLFYQLLVGELELTSGQPGVAYQVLLDAARRTRDEELFKQVLGIALKAQAGDQALQTAQAWREAKPSSLEAQQTTIQLMAALNRPQGIAAPLRDLLTLTPEANRVAALASLPGLFQRANDSKAVYAALAPFLEEQAKQAPTHDVALYVQARLAIAAGENDKALALTQALAQSAPQLEDTMQLALELLPVKPEAEALITERLQRQPESPNLRFAYGLALARGQRIAEAGVQLRAAAKQKPDNAQSWFALGSVELDLQHPAEAEQALREYLKLLPAEKPAPKDADASAEADAEGDVSIAKATTDARQQAWLMLSAAAERQGHLKEATDWLNKVDKPRDPVALAMRRATLLQRQGKLGEAKALLAALPEESDEQFRMKRLAQAQLLREARDWKGAYEQLSQAEARAPKDVDLIYERAMLAEKLNRFEEMETLLKRTIELKPDYYNAYNALGYSLADRNVRLPEARELIAKALALEPKQPALVDSMGWVEFRSGNLAEAQKLLRQAYADFPDPEVAAHLGEVLWAQGEHDEALRVWREALKREPDNESIRETTGRLKVKP
ncbi:MAG TPA: tetratricopeptide repeat protein [Burkholderiaceae bacterium]|jgi:tetratricopeptide (TPR) repeat protein